MSQEQQSNSTAEQTQQKADQQKATQAAPAQRAAYADSTRPEDEDLAQLKQKADRSNAVTNLQALQRKANESGRVHQLKSTAAALNETTTKGDGPVQRAENNTGLPDNLKSGIESLSGYSMDDVKVHRNSDKPAQLQAHAYAQGTDIHLGPGQEKHLPHEAWHVVQQKQGRVKPTMQMKGKVNVNDDAGLEKEADVMGARATGFNITDNGNPINHDLSDSKTTSQLYKPQDDGNISFNASAQLATDGTQKSQSGQDTEIVQHGITKRQFLEYHEKLKEDAALVAGKIPPKSMFDACTEIKKQTTEGRGMALTMNSDPLLANVMISHSWGGNFQQFAKALENSPLPDDAVLWICTFAIHQKDAVKDAHLPGPSIQEQLPLMPFKQVLESPSTKQLKMIFSSGTLREQTDDDNNTSVAGSSGDIHSRIWCIQELLCGIERAEKGVEDGFTIESIVGATDDMLDNPNDPVSKEQMDLIRKYNLQLRNQGAPIDEILGGREIKSQAQMMASSLLSFTKSLEVQKHLDKLDDLTEQQKGEAGVRDAVRKKGKDDFQKPGNIPSAKRTKATPEERGFLYVDMVANLSKINTVQKLLTTDSQQFSKIKAALKDEIAQMDAATKSKFEAYQTMVTNLQGEIKKSREGRIERKEKLKHWAQKAREMAATKGKPVSDSKNL